MSSGTAAIRVRRPTAIRGGQISSIASPIIAAGTGSSQLTGYSLIASRSAVSQSAALTRPEAKKLCASQRRMNRSSSGPSVRSAKLSVSRTIDMRLAAGIIISSRLRPEGPILQQQGMPVGIADHRSARAVGERDDPGGDEPDMVLLQCPDLILEI